MINSSGKFYNDAPTKNEDESNMDVQGMRDESEKNSDYILLHKVKNSNETKFKSTDESDKEKSSKPTIIKR